MKPAQHNGLMHVTDVCADPAEALALSITRFLAAGYSTGDVACWDAAYSGAEQLLGAEPGGRLVAGLIGLVRALRTERVGGWTYMPVTCCRVTTDEQAMMRLITLARFGDAELVSQAAADVAGLQAAPSTTAAAHVLGAVIEDIASALPARVGSRVRSPTSVH